MYLADNSCSFDKDDNILSIRSMRRVGMVNVGVFGFFHHFRKEWHRWIADNNVAKVRICMQQRLLFIHIWKGSCRIKGGVTFSHLHAKHFDGPGDRRHALLKPLCWLFDIPPDMFLKSISDETFIDSETAKVTVLYQCKMSNFHLRIVRTAEKPMQKNISRYVQFGYSRCSWCHGNVIIVLPHV